MNNRPNGNFTLTPHAPGTRSSSPNPNGAQKPSTTSVPNPTFVPPPTVKK